MTAPPVVETPTTAVPQEPELGERLGALERDNRRLRRLGVFLIVAMGVLLGLAGAVFTVAARRGIPGRLVASLEARSFVLRDEGGRVRATLGVQDSSPRLILYDGAGRQRITLNLLADGSPGLSFRDDSGRSRMVLGLLPDQTTTLVFADRRGVTRTVLGLSPDESSTLVFANGQGAAQTGLGIDRDGHPAFTFEASGAEAAATDHQSRAPSPPAPEPRRR